MNVDTIRCFLIEHDGRTYMRATASHAAMFSEFMGLLSAHPVWSLRLDDIQGVRVSRHRLNDAVILQLKTNKIWFTVSWRDCRERKRASRANVRSVEQKRLTSAMRYSVRKQTMMWAEQHMVGARCVKCASTERLQVDHRDPPFDYIVQAFLAENLESRPTKFDLARTCESRFMETDTPFKRRWQTFHNKNATYQWLCQSCNSSKGNTVAS